jgi:hypothetical protein
VFTAVPAVRTVSPRAVRTGIGARMSQRGMIHAPLESCANSISPPARVSLTVSGRFTYAKVTVCSARVRASNSRTPLISERRMAVCGQNSSAMRPAGVADESRMRKQCVRMKYGERSTARSGAT